MFNSSEFIHTSSLTQIWVIELFNSYRKMILGSIYNAQETGWSNHLFIGTLLQGLFNSSEFIHTAGCHEKKNMQTWIFFCQVFVSVWCGITGNGGSKDKASVFFCSSGTDTFQELTLREKKSNLIIISQIIVQSNVWGTVSLRSCEKSKNNKSFNDKIHYITMILYLNYQKNKKTVFSIKKCFQMYANIT